MPGDEDTGDGEIALGLRSHTWRSQGFNVLRRIGDTTPSN